MNEQISDVFAITGVGLAAVFVVLAVLAMVIALLSRADEALVRRAATQPAAPPAEPEPTIDNLTLVLITATVATLLQGRFHIRTVRRLRQQPSNGGSWAHQGRAELQGSHVISKKREGGSR